MTVGDRIRARRTELGMTQEELAKKAGYKSRSSINKIELSRTLSNSKVEKMSKLLECSIPYLMGWNEEQEKVVRKSEKIKVLGRVAAGIPIEAIENIIDYEEIPKEMAMNGEYFGLRIKGDSMMPTIRDGDTVIVRKQDDAETDQIVIAMINGNDATCKRLMKYDGGISLISFNPAYPPMMFSNEQIESLPVKIIGRVVENRQKF